MDGLIPLIYKAVKERRSRSYSRCSSAGSGADRFGAGAGSDQQKQWGVPLRDEHGGTARTEDGVSQHRRHRSLEELAGEVGSAAPEWRGAGGMSRGRSVRIFSCIGGGM